MKKLLILSVLVAFGSCMSPKRMLKKQAKACLICPESDSINEKTVTIIKKDTVYLTRMGAPIIIENPCEELCDSFGKLKQFVKIKRRNGVITSIKTRKDKLILKCDTDSLQAIIENYETKTIKTQKITPQAKVVYRDTKFQGFTFWWFWITAGLILVFGIVKSIKLF